MAQFYCQCGGLYKNSGLEVLVPYLNKKITVYNVPGHKCSQCGDERVPNKQRHILSKLVKVATPDENNRIEYFED